MVPVEPPLDAPHMKYVPALRQLTHHVLSLELHQAYTAHFLLLNQSALAAEVEVLKPSSRKIHEEQSFLIRGALTLHISGTQVQVNVDRNVDKRSLELTEWDPYTSVEDYDDSGGYTGLAICH